MVRGVELKQGDFHLIVHVCIFRSNGDMLVQQRQSSKEGWPNNWDLTVGGSSITGEISQTAAQRELFEELGLMIDFQYIHPHLTINFEKGFDDYYLLEENVQLHTLTLQDEDVQNLKWASKEEILMMIKAGEFMLYYESLIQFLFDVENSVAVFKDHRIEVTRAPVF